MDLKPLCSPKLETVTQSFSEECGEEHHSLGIQNPAIDQKSLHVCAEVLMCIAACVYYCVIGFVSRQGTQCSLKSYCRFLCSQEQINDRPWTDSTPYCSHQDGPNGPSGQNYHLCEGYTVRPWDARFLGIEKTGAAQNSCNFCYLIGWRQDDQKIVLLKVFTT